MPYNIPPHLKGLSDAEVAASQKKYGYNRTDSGGDNKWYGLLLDILKEPMLILLIAVAIIYVIVGDYMEAGFMFFAIIAVSAISFYQDNRSKKALEELEKLNEPLSVVIRNSIPIKIPTHEIAVGDLCVVEEGNMINADGRIVHSNDFSVNESSLTGESYSVYKDSESEDNEIYSGTNVVSGLAVFEVNKIGAQTRLGRIGESIKSIEDTKSPLQIQITKFVKNMAFIGVAVFLAIWIYSYIQTGSLIKSLLVGLTLAMSILPEEIPVAFTTFMALGAWKLMRRGIIVKRSSIVETLGSTTVICTDKTGTITVNSMELKQLYDFRTDTIYNKENFDKDSLNELISYAMWASEPVPFDPMEKTIHNVYEQSEDPDLRPEFEMIHEYPLGGKPPMMTHIFENSQKERRLAAKGAPEAILGVCNLTNEEKTKIRKQLTEAGKNGYRVLGVAKSNYKGYDFPQQQQDISFEFLGLTIFYDPPKKGINDVFKKIYDAGIQLKVITGDSKDTVTSIARQAGVRDSDEVITGDEIIHHSEAELIPVAEKTTLFARMFPEAKLAVVNSLKKSGEVVAMMGDGVNDAPALKAAHIGVAMGNKGTEIAKAAADLVLTNDDLDKLITGIAAGRRIYANIKKAIQYVISIHIPIILTVSLPLFLGWIFPEIFTPVHVIFFELVMGPTCSIVYESEPMERNTMIRPPRKMTDTFFSRKELLTSIIQGLAITAGVLFMYQWTVRQGGNEELTRAMVFSTLIFANIFLSYTNRSFYYSLFESFKNKNPLFPAITGLTLLILFLILYAEPFKGFFKVESPDLGLLGMGFLVAAISVLWFEVYKFWRRKGDSFKN